MNSSTKSVISDNRFLSSHRLLTSYEFDQVFKHNQIRVGSSEFLVLAKANSIGNNRLGLVIGKKITALAVNRNLIKRSIRESFRTHLDKTLGFDLVIITRTGVRQKSKPEINLLLKSLWQKLEHKIQANQPQ